MARLLGIDATKTSVRVAVIRTSYRRVTLEGLGEADVAVAGSEVEAIRAAVKGAKVDACAVALAGDKAYFRRLELPAAAQKELGNVLNFELESGVPFEMSDMVVDYRVLKSGTPAPASLSIFAVLAQTELVRERIHLVREATGMDPERVGVGPLPFTNLASVMPDLEKPSLGAAAGVRPVNAPIAILELSDVLSEVVILVGGEPVFARSLSRGTVGLPESAPALARELRQTFSAWRTLGGDPLLGLYLVGTGASAGGAAYFLSTELGMAVLPLPRPRMEGMGPDDLEKLPRFAKAIGLALGLMGRAKAMNLRRGALEAERSYPFLREKIPLLAGLGAVIAVSFAFSTFAELRALDADKEALLVKLGASTRDVLGEETTDPAKAKELVDGTSQKGDEDPMPRVDAFDVMVQISKAVPADVLHDVLDLDVQRGKVTLQGTVPTVGDAETIAKNLKEFRCFNNVKITRTAEFTAGKQKYVLEFDLKCEDKKKKPAGSDAEAQPQPTQSAKPEKEKPETGR